MATTEFSLTNSSDFRIRQITIDTPQGSFDLSTVFDELNIFENMFTPCASGNIVVRDSNNLLGLIELMNTVLFIEIEKSNNNPELFNYQKRFTVYKISNKTNLNMGIQSYIIHFVSEEFAKSEKKKINIRFKGLYSDLIEKILKEELNIPRGALGRVWENNPPTTPKFLQTKGERDIIIPTMTPFEAIDWLTRRSIADSPKSRETPDCLFYETKGKYAFTSLGELSALPEVFPGGIKIRPKNISSSSGSDEVLDAINYKILQPTNIIENVTNGVYAGTFFGWDTVTRLKKTVQYDFNYFWNKMDHLNAYPIIPAQSKSELLTNFDSRIVVYPFAEERRNVGYITQNNNADAQIIDNTHEYVLQRKMIMYNLMQRRVQLTMPGNFGLFIGSVVKIDFPNFVSGLDGDNAVDPIMSGRYVVTAARHIFRYDRHETVIEVATDSTNARFSR